MPNLKQVIDVLETLYPLRYAEEWDEPGLIVGDLSHDVHRIVFAADPTSAIIDKAIATGADLLITHHPLFFRSVRRRADSVSRGDIVRRLYQHGCGLWVGHTNADAAYRGVGQAAADYFGLIDQKPLVPIDDANASHPVGLGRVGRLPKPVALRDVRSASIRRSVRSWHDQRAGHPGMRRFGHFCSVCGHSAWLRDSLFNEVRATGADVYVTSDLRHHPVTDAIEQARYEARMRSQGIMLGHGMAGRAMCVPASSTPLMPPSNPCGSTTRSMTCQPPSNKRPEQGLKSSGSTTRPIHGRCPLPRIEIKTL